MFNPRLLALTFVLASLGRSVEAGPSRWRTTEPPELVSVASTGGVADDSSGFEGGFFPGVADIDGDGDVDLDDLLVLLARFDLGCGDSDFDYRVDVSMDGVVDLDDLLLGLAEFGCSTAPQQSKVPASDQ